MTPKMIPEKAIHALFELARAHDLLELSVTTPEGKFKIRRGVKASVERPPVAESPPQMAVEKAKEPDRQGLVKVVSPLMGIFYRAPAPGIDPFVSLGERVGVGDTLCIIEAMKVMNEITSEVRGTVEEIVAKNGEVVEEGEVLFYLKPEKNT